MGPKEWPSREGVAWALQSHPGPILTQVNHVIMYCQSSQCLNWPSSKRFCLAFQSIKDGMAPLIIYPIIIAVRCNESCFFPRGSYTGVHQGLMGEAGMQLPY